MEPITSITISCEGATTVELDELQDLQGNLKDLPQQNYVKLRNSIVKYGFSFPIDIWIDQEGKKWIIDAHQRVRTLKQMRTEGVTIPPLPASITHAKDKKEAKEKLLVLLSRYGKITREGYDGFIDEVGFEVSESDMSDLIEIPEVQMWDNNDSPAETATSDSGDSNPVKVRQMKCPSCGHEWNLFDNAPQ